MHAARATLSVGLATALITAASAGAASSEQRLIRPAIGIGKLRLGMTEAEVRRTMGRPRFVVNRRAAFGFRSVEYQYGLAEYTVRLFGRARRLRAVRVGTTLVRERTPRGLGVGSLERTVLRAYPSMRCQPLRTYRSGSATIVATVQRECTLFTPSGRRTIFTTDVQERMFEVITPRMWAARARVIEVSVAAAT
jgi:hypothetical protein